MTDRRPLGLPFSSPTATEEVEPPAARRRLPVERGVQFLLPPSPATEAPPTLTRRVLADGGLTFSAPDQQP